MPISALVANFAVKTGEFTDSTPPIIRAFYLTTDRLIELAELIQRLFQGLRVLYFFTRVQGQVSIHAEVCAYTFTCTPQTPEIKTTPEVPKSETQATSESKSILGPAIVFLFILIGLGISTIYFLQRAFKEQR